jgi:triacylglycerol lipase
MIARALMLTMLLVGGVGAAGAMLFAGGREPATLIEGAVAAILLVIVLAVALTYAVAFANASRPPLRAGPGRVILAMLRELLAHVGVFAILAPFAGLRSGRSPHVARRSGDPPVLLVHGYLLNGAAWWRVARMLRGAGLTVHVATVEPPLASIDAMADSLAAQIEAVCAATGASRLSLVAHSMGGLVCRAYLRARGNARVARLVTIASPHHGTAIARLGLGTCAREMTPGSAWLAALAEWERHAEHPATLALFSYYDNYIAPQESSRLSWADTGILPPLGHVEMYFSRTVAQRVCDALGPTAS